MQLFGRLRTQATKENTRNQFQDLGKLSKESRIEEDKPISKTLEKFQTLKKEKKGKKIEATSLKITEEERESIEMALHINHHRQEN